MSSEVHIAPDAETLTHDVAERLAAQVATKTSAGGAFSLTLAGGKTPRGLYTLLAGAYRDRIPWAQVQVFWGDERYVPHGDPRSNYRMAKQALLDHVPLPAGNVHPMPTDLGDPDSAAQAYEGELRAFFEGGARFDLVLLGLGADGHTASLFPGSPALDVHDRWVVASRAPVDPPLRLTLTLPALNQALTVFFLVTGADKAGALRQALAGSSDPRLCPAAGVRPGYGSVVWWIDKAAAGLVRPPTG